ncbi:hypothetical protein HRTV-25_gp66 [Halorubrum tailed virus 25]|uniref:Uncharacterized protein n=1 Tax=Halorubrum tailed virus 25 TaxID=2878006 RepID=A0AAE8XYK7_9CAUD|nr:hypothetical protein M1M37_gp066 [Halorubrum tailed virus 25]UBF22647.1 hypothetical protein HRTV-25_gp66 [Halorubrum tailed virus 25]
MSYDYSSYASNDNDNSGSSSGSSGGSGGDDLNLTMVPHAAIEGDLVKVFGNDNSFGQSLGLSWENVELVDGCLYYDPDKGKHKVFPWKDVVGIAPDEADDLTADQANQYLVKNYGTTEKRYELVEAVVPEKDEPVEIGNAIMWYSGSDEYGPKSASKTLAKILTKLGRDMVIPEEDSPAEKYIKGWLRDTSAQNVLRDDLDGRRFAFFEVKKQSNQSDRQYHHPIVVDAQTGAQVTVANATDTEGGDTSGTLDGDSDDESGENGGPAAAAIPEPISDFISTCDSLGFTDRDRAATLLGDLMADDGNDLTADMVSDFGGEDAVLDEVAE